MSFSKRTWIALFLAFTLIACFVPVNGGSIQQSAYRIIQQAGTPLAMRTVINWVSGATCVDNASTKVTDCTATGAGGGITSVFGNVGPTIPNLSGDCTTSGSSVITCPGLSPGPPANLYASAGAFVKGPWGFTTVNAGVNDVITGLSDGSEVITIDRGHLNSIVARVKALPVAPWTVSACFDGGYQRADNGAVFGLVLTDGTTSAAKAQVAMDNNSSTKILLPFNWTDLNTVSGQVSFGADMDIWGTGSGLMCQRVQDDGTNRYYWGSQNAGVSWTYMGQTKQGNTAFLTPTFAGYGVSTGNGNFMRQIRIVHFLITSSACGTNMGGAGDSGRYSFGNGC